jgi:hypothetical protein
MCVLNDKQPLPILSEGRFTPEGVVHSQLNAATRARMPNTLHCLKEGFSGPVLGPGPRHSGCHPLRTGGFYTPAICGLQGHQPTNWIPDHYSPLPGPHMLMA